MILGFKPVIFFTFEIDVIKTAHTNLSFVNSFSFGSESFPKVTWVSSTHENDITYVREEAAKYLNWQLSNSSDLTFNSYFQIRQHPRN